jgi:hypothetical protein
VGFFLFSLTGSWKKKYSQQNWQKVVDEIGNEISMMGMMSMM